MKMTTQERKFHRKTAAHCFNRTWDYLEKRQRTGKENKMMLHLAHASRYHWSLVGTPRNQTVGDWQVSRVYVAIGEPNLSLHFARSSFELAQKNKLYDIMPTIFEAMSRAHAVGGNRKLATSYLDKARKLIASSSIDKEDREIYLGQIHDTENMIRKLPR